MLVLHPKLDLRVQDGRLENRLENREGFGVRQTLGLGHLAPRVARRKWLPSVRSSDKAVNTSLFAHLWSLECVPSLGAGWLSWLDLADNPARQADPAACPPSAEVPSVLHHIGFDLVLGLVLGSSLLPQLETAHVDAGSPSQAASLPWQWL